MLSQMAQLLVEVVAGFFVYLLLGRFLLQWLRVPFRNPVGEFVVALTNWIVRPARRVIPALGGLDLASLAAAWVVQLSALGVLYALRGWPFAAAPGAAAAILAAVSLVDLLRFSLYILTFALIVQAVLSWVNPYSPVGPVFDAMTRPFLRPVRRWLPPVANIDLSPLVVLVVLQLLLIPLAYLRALAGGVF